ncbi:MAG: glycosyltransferase family 39 protein, partial [Gammaproteobacteria bacterium]|nr:glycosyltransferase family 39 protein [Gammaproteobacteria bacterium]
GLFYAFWIGSYALFTPDEGRYSEVAREMVASGDYITPRLNGVAFLDKPALYYWLQASAIQLFGLKEWALRFWPAALGIIGCLLTYTAGYVLFNRRTGILAGIILATSPLYYGAAHYANLDLEVAVLISNALLLFLLGMHFAKTRWRTLLLCAAYVFAGLAFLTKGLIGIVFPAMIIGAWIIILNRWKTFAEIRLFTGLTLFILIVVPWYYLVQLANPEFLHFFFITQQVTRFLTKATFNSQAVWWFYIPVVLMGFMPWSIFVIQAVVFHVKRIWQSRQIYKNELFLLLWFISIFIFFSIPKSKTVGYILPVFPPLALLSANYIDFYWNKTVYRGITNAMKAFIIFSVLVVVSCFIAPHFVALENGLERYLYIIGIIFLLAGIFTFSCLKKSSIMRFFNLLTLTACLFLLTLVASSHVINSKTIKPLAVGLKAYIKPNDEIVTYYKYYQDLPIYLERHHITIVADWHASDIPFNDNWLREMWYGMPFQDTSSWLIEDETFWEHWNSNKRVFVFMNSSYFKEFSKKASGRLFKMGEYNNVVLVSNSVSRV